MRSPNQTGNGNLLHFEIKRGLDLPITGAPQAVVEDGAAVKQVAVTGSDFVGMKPTMAVAAGDRVVQGQLLFTDKNTPGVRYTSPAAGTVASVNRGQKRALQSVVIAVDGSDEETFASYGEDRLAQLSRQEVTDNLVASGLWTAIRERPFGKVPSPESSPHSLFVNAMDTNPLGLVPSVAMEGRERDFRNGLTVLSKISGDRLFLCHDPNESIPGADFDFVTSASFSGPHPAGLAGTHIHFLDPVDERKSVWHLDYQDVTAIGALFTSGRLDVRRVISLAGAAVKRPRFVRTRMGARITDLVENEISDGEVRVISGSVLYGRTVEGPLSYLGRYHSQISVIPEGQERKFMEWHMPGLDRFSVKRTFISALFRDRRFNLTSSTQGSVRAMVPIGMYEKVMPLDIMITHLLRALIVGDTDQAQALGCLELDEEDLALCTFVCPGKYDYSPILRNNLIRIEMEG